MLKLVALATLVSGTLDIVFAMLLTVYFGRHIGDMLRTVASGPFPAASGMGAAGACLGLLTHFALMAVMAVIFMHAAGVRPALLQTPYLTGVAFGVVTYFIMNWAVVPLRFGAPLPPKLMLIATQGFAHIVLVGLPFALIALRYQSILTKQRSG